MTSITSSLTTSAAVVLLVTATLLGGGYFALSATDNGTPPQSPPQNVGDAQPEATTPPTAETAVDVTSPQTPNEAAIAEEDPTVDFFNDRSRTRLCVERALDMTVDFEFIGTDFEVALQHLGDFYLVPIVINHAELKSLGVEAADLKVDLVIADIRFESMLELMLRPHGLSWVIEDEVLKIVSIKTATAQRESHVYSLRHLGKDVTAEVVMEAVQGSIPWDSWNEKGVFVPLDGGLLISTNQKNHRRISTLLQQLRDFSNPKAALNAHNQAAGGKEVLNFSDLPIFRSVEERHLFEEVRSIKRRIESMTRDKEAVRAQVNDIESYWREVGGITVEGREHHKKAVVTYEEIVNSIHKATEELKRAQEELDKLRQRLKSNPQESPAH